MNSSVKSQDELFIMGIDELRKYFPILNALVSSLIAKLSVLCLLYSDHFPQFSVSLLYISYFQQVFVKFFLLLLIKLAQIALLFSHLSYFLVSIGNLVSYFS
jgi:hypothetical protein